MDNNISLYIHIPFCKSKCYYCDFNSYADKNNKLSTYFDLLKKEMQMYEKQLRQYVVNTIYIGGGTPSSVDVKYIYDVLDISRRNFYIEPSAEITLEANPGTLTFENLVLYKSFGINRLSIGLQAWQDGILNKIGRIHTSSDFGENYAMAREAGFKNINVDLMFGLPQQSLQDWDETISNVIRLRPEHISCYGLIIEEGTKFSQYISEGLLKLPDEDIEREMYDVALKKLTANGYNHYEISNFAVSGMECRHNLKYWNCGQYIGIGAGAHSYFNDLRYWNFRDIEQYIEIMLSTNELPVAGSEKIDECERMKEYIILGLRMVKGVSKQEFEKRFKQSIDMKYGEQINKGIRQHLLEDINGTLRLTRKGLDLANEVLTDFI